jgi:steroid delta-isomerase-like uncharacterized protein
MTIGQKRKMRKLLCVIFLAVLLCFTFACQNKAEKAELEKFRTQAKVEEQNKAIVTQYMEGLNKGGDFEVLNELTAPEFVTYCPSRSNEPISRKEDIEGHIMFNKAFPDLSWNVQEMIPAGEKVIVSYIGRGTHKGEFEGIPTTGNQIEWSGTAIIRIENGKIVEEKEDNDGLNIMMQLGMELRPKEVKK